MNDTIYSRRRNLRTTQVNHQQLTSQLRIDELQIFNYVAKRSSFSDAAKVLGLSQPTVSKRIRKLEEVLDLRLFDRTTRQVVLTEIGQELLTYSDKLLSNFEDAVNFVQLSQKEPIGLLRLGVPQSMIQVIDSTFYADFVAKYPGIQFSFVALKSVDQLLNNDEVDLMLHYQPVNNPQLECLPLWQIDVDFFAGAGYLQRVEPIEHPLQLEQHDCLLIHNSVLPDNQWQWRDENGGYQPLELQPLARFTYLEQALDWARRDLGVIWCPANQVNHATPEKRLVRLFDGQFATTLHVNAVYPRRQVLAPKIRVFIDELKRYLVEKDATKQPGLTAERVTQVA